MPSQIFINLIVVVIIWSFISIIVRLYTNYNTITESFATSKCWVNTNEFSEAQKIFEQRDIIKKDLINILSSDKWGIWSSDYKSTPIFTKMTDSEIVSRI